MIERVHASTRSDATAEEVLSAFAFGAGLEVYRESEWDDTPDLIVTGPGGEVEIERIFSDELKGHEKSAEGLDMLRQIVYRLSRKYHAMNDDGN